MVVRIIIILIALLATHSYAQDWLGCALDDSFDTDGLADNINNMDTLNGVAIFACFPEDTITMGSDTLLTRHVEFGDTSKYGPGQILLKSSFGAHILNLKVNPGLDNKFIVLPHSQAWYDSAYGHANQYFTYLRYMNEDVLVGLDSLIDFGLYDGDKSGGSLCRFRLCQRPEQCGL